MKRATLTLLFLLLGILGAAPLGRAADAVAIAEGQLEGREYVHPGLGWKFVVPEGWHVSSKEEIAAVVQRGTSRLKAVGGYDEGGCVHLLYCNSGRAAMFTSTAQDPVPGETASLADTFQALVRVMEQAGLRVVSDRRQEVIGGVKFDLQELIAYRKGEDTELFRHFLYQATFGKRTLSISISGNSKEQRETLLAAWRASRFRAESPGTGK